MSLLPRMVVRVKLRGFPEAPRQFGQLAAYLLTPVALAGYVLAFWRIGADLNWFGEFFVSNGLLSRWQVWILLGAATQAIAYQLTRAARRGETVNY